MEGWFREEVFISLVGTGGRELDVSAMKRRKGYVLLKLSQGCKWSNHILGLTNNLLSGFRLSVALHMLRVYLNPHGLGQALQKGLG
jgi:hypothetical protein